MQGEEVCSHIALHWIGWRLALGLFDYFISILASGLLYDLVLDCSRCTRCIYVYRYWSGICSALKKTIYDI